jgi:mono/diheme cytochrome c family protein
MRATGILGLAALALALTACATPEDVADRETARQAARGQAYAIQNCAACHAIEAYQEMSPNPDAPAFAEAARMPGMNRRALNAWLNTPHPSMPNLIVPPEQIDELSAYISTLEN